MAMRRLAKPFTPIRLAALVGLAIGVLALNAAAPPEAFAVCNHAGNTSSACPVGVADGSTSISFNADGSINWPGGVITSGNCCAASGGTETGGGPQVQVYNSEGGKELANFFAYDSNFRGGVRTATSGTTTETGTEPPLSVSGDIRRPQAGPDKYSNQFYEALATGTYVPTEFAAPYVRVRQDGEILDVSIENPSGGESHLFRETDPFAEERANLALDELRKGTPFKEAVDKANAAEFGGGISNPSVTAEQLGSLTITNSTINPASAPTRPPITGTSIGEIGDASFGGRAYGRVEIIEGPDGKPHAVGTGEFAGWDFGEAKQGRAGNWRNEGGPWTPPPANYTPPTPVAGRAVADRTTIMSNDASSTGGGIYQPVTRR
jgi:hypothetical protein